MIGFLINIGKVTLQNENFRKVLKTAQNNQLVVMSFHPMEISAPKFMKTKRRCLYMFDLSIL